MAKVYPITDKNKLKLMAAILLNQSYRNYLLFAMGANLGLRISDYIKMSVADCAEICRTEMVDLQQVKTQKPIYYRVPDEILEVMQDYIRGRAESDWLFPSRKGDKAITEHRAWEIIYEAAIKAGITENIGCHSLRKSFGYFHYQKNKNIRLLMEIFNHSSESITLRYIGVLQDDIDESMRGISIGIVSKAALEKAKKREASKRDKVNTEETTENEKNTLFEEFGL